MDVLGVYRSLVVTVAAAAFLGAATTSASQLRDLYDQPDIIPYCEGDTFEGKCKENEVLLITSAEYGRMHVGRCLDHTTVDRDCREDVGDYFDRHCSGRHSCEVRVSSIIDQLPGDKPACLRSYRGYLEVGYVCVQVATAPELQCNTADHVNTPSATGFISNTIAEETSCGSNDSPWIITAQSGQRIQITMLDFASSSRDPADFTQGIPKMCQVYAVVKESGYNRGDTICGSMNRVRPVYTSIGNTVEVRIYAKRNDPERFFLLKHQAIGCPDLPAPLGGWVERVDQIARFRCNGSDQTWRLTCEGSVWTGSRNNCTTLRTGASSGGAGSDQSFMGLLTGSQWASIIIILAIAITLGLVIFLVGLVYLRRRRNHHDRPIASVRDDGQIVPDYYATQNQDPVPVPESGYGSENKQSDPYPYMSENDYYRTWQMQRHLVPNKGTGSGTAAHPVSRQQHLPPSYDTMDSSSHRGTDHIYESPKFERRGMSVDNGNDLVTPAQYYELDPHTNEAEQQFTH